MPARAAARRTPASGAACDRRQGAPSTAYTSAARWRAPTRAGSLPARATARRAPARQRRHPARPPQRRLEQRPPPRPAPRRLDRRRPPRRCSRAAGCSPGVAGAAPSESTADPSGARNLASVGRRCGVGPILGARYWDILVRIRPGKSGGKNMRGGGLEPPRVISPLAPQTSASANSAILAQIGSGPDGRLVLTKRPGAVEAEAAGGRYLTGSRALRRRALRLRPRVPPARARPRARSPPAPAAGRPAPRRPAGGSGGRRRARGSHGW